MDNKLTYIQDEHNKLSYIIEHIEEFASYIRTDTIDKIIDSMDLQDTIYSIKYMIRNTAGSAIKDIVILIYRRFLLVGVCIIDNKKIVHQNSSLDGIDIYDYLPKYLKSEHELPPSKEALLYKNTLLKELNIQYDNKLSTLEKLDLLQEYVNKEEVIQKELTIKEEEKKKIKEYKQEKRNNDLNILANEGYDWIRKIDPKEAQRRASKKHYEKNKEAKKAKQREYEREKRAKKKRENNNEKN